MTTEAAVPSRLELLNPPLAAPFLRGERLTSLVSLTQFSLKQEIVAPLPSEGIFVVCAATPRNSIRSSSHSHSGSQQRYLINSPDLSLTSYPQKITPAVASPKLLILHNLPRRFAGTDC
jgi:hypothetical protein